MYVMISFGDYWRAAVAVVAARVEELEQSPAVPELPQVSEQSSAGASGRLWRCPEGERTDARNCRSSSRDQ